MESSEVVLRFPAPNNPLSINKANRMHWAQKKRELDPWREETAWAWKSTKITERRVVMGKPCNVQVFLPFRTAQRRDPHNYVGTVVKAIVDALVKAGAWPDDTPEWVTVVEPVCKIGGDAMISIALR